MPSPHTKPCDKCLGTGLLKREPRRKPDGTADPADTVKWPEITCDKCGGSGEIGYHPNPEETRHSAVPFAP